MIHTASHTNRHTNRNANRHTTRRRAIFARCCLVLCLSPVVAESLLPNEDVTGLRVHHPQDMAERETVAVSHPAFSNALRVHVRTVPEQVHQVQVNQRNALPVSAGDTLRIRTILRSQSPGGVPARMKLFVQDTTRGFQSVFNRDLVVGPNWESLTYTVTVPEDFDADGLQFSVFLGEQLQVVDFGMFTVTRIDPDAETSVIPDLQRAVSVQGAYVEIRSEKDTITGSLPAGWEEDSAWADVEVNYRPQMNNPYAGDRALRVEVGNVHNGNVQFRVPNISVAPSHLIRMRIPLRSEDNRSVTVNLRQRGSPYKLYWQTNLAARPEWGIFEVLAIVPDTDPDASLMFVLNTPGTLEVGDFELEYLTPEQVLDAHDFEGNLLQTSSFPLGLTAPWAYGANGTTSEHLGADPDVLGPSGVPALRQMPHAYGQRPMMQITSPFIGKPGAVHTFSFWAKAERPGMSVSMRMGPPSAQLWTGDWHRSLSLTTEWTRYEHSVLLPPAPDMLYLARITSHDTGTYWVDQVMVEVSDTAGVFQAAGPVEVHALAARDFGLSFEDEPLAYRLALTGDLTQVDRIEGTVLDLYGTETPLAPLYLPTAVDAVETVDTQLPETDLLGSFLVTHQAVDRDGNALGNPAEVLLHRIRRPHHWGRMAFDSPFGTHVTSTPENTRMAKALGFNWNRLHYAFNWSGIQREDGSWHFDHVDKSIGVHDDNDLLILTHFGGVPARYSVVNENWDGASSWWRVTAAPRMDAMDAFEEYAYRLLSHAGNSLQGVEVWNEPFLAGFFVGDVQNGRPVREEPVVMAEMKRRARRAAERAEYTGKLIWNTGPHYGEGERAFSTALVDLGAAEMVDALSFHRYTNANLGFPGDRFAVDLDIIREVFAERPALQHLWNSEGGHGLSEIFNMYRNVPPSLRARADMQAVQYVRYFLSNFSAGAEKVFIYTYYQQDSWSSNYGYMNVDGSLSQVAPASSNMAWHLEGKQFTEMRPVSDTVYAQHYAGDSEHTVVLLPNGRGLAELKHLPEGVRIADVYGNPPALPVNFTANLLYLTAPALTLDLAEQILQASRAEELPEFATQVPPGSEERDNPETMPASPMGIAVLSAMILALFLLLLRWFRK